MKKIQIPGSKSITNRALILAAISDKPVILNNILESDDSLYMREALSQLGVSFENLGKNSIKVIPPKKLQSIDGKTPELFIGNAGTAARFLSALSLVTKGKYTLNGIERMQQRPQADLMTALSFLGIEVKCLKEKGFLPASFQNTSFTFFGSAYVEISGKISSQFLSGLLLVGAKMRTGLTIQISDGIPSLPYVKMTIEMLKTWGIQVKISDNWDYFEIKSGINAPSQYDIPADMSSASYPILWSCLKKEPIIITNFGENTLQGDEQFLEIAKQAGAKIKKQGPQVQIIPPEIISNIGAFNWEVMPDVSMTGMILASFMPEGQKAKFTGLESLRVKECDRIVAMEQLRELGVKIETEGDIVTVHGHDFSKLDPKKSINIDSFDDHRIAMCFGVLKSALELKSDPHQESFIKISEPECVAKTWPNFWVDLADWENQLRPVSGVIITKDDLFLIVKKPRDKHAWQFPQGGVDEGETLLQGAKRELHEECGDAISVKFKGEKPVGIYQYLFPKEFKRHDKKLLGAKVCFFKAEYLSGEVIVDGEELIDHKWVKTSELQDYFDETYLNQLLDFLN